MLTLRNPHSVLSALRHRPEDVKSVTLIERKSTPAWEEVRAVASKKGIPILTAARKRDKALPRKEGRESLAEAEVLEKSPVSLNQAMDGPSSERGLWLAFDQIQDPHNVGAIFRTAAFFGVNGIVMTSDRSASLTATVYDVAAGGVEEVPFAVEANLRNILEEAKKNEFWILGTSEHAKAPLKSFQLDRKWLLVLGNEEKGIRRLTQELCDETCVIPPKGGVTSLNVSVAAGILIQHFSD